MLQCQVYDIVIGRVYTSRSARHPYGCRLPPDDIITMAWTIIHAPKPRIPGTPLFHLQKPGSPTLLRIHLKARTEK